MANFIELTDSTRMLKIYLNINHIVFFGTAPEIDCTSIYVNKKNYLDVQETPKEILQLIELSQIDTTQMDISQRF